ncbi:hypothetical protein [Anabaena azotica]|uniref:Uncharacterized protein n=1 Tax=Anabaena azotica FACHB-119 TaxID=947527 RepID=A0ABR8DE49_9NOST|nr:hypothetical protein [Anabaena azotica]MBD2504896.1 hypothetical protein [Anabaena azotica FACHB-119]
MEHISEELQQKVDKEFDNFWRDIVCDENGCLDLEKVKRELYDYSLAMQYVSEVYCELTNGHISKIHADPQIVIRMVYEQIEGLEMIFIGVKSETKEQVHPVGIASS